MSDHLIVCDTETTGLKHEAHAKLLELSIIIVNNRLDVLWQGYWLNPEACGPAAQGLYESAGQYVKDMHTKNGLWSELYSATPNLAAQQEILQLFAQMGVSANSKGVILNRNPDFDRFFLAKDGFADVDKCFQHQMIDVCSWQQFIVRNYGSDARYKPAADQPHRALGDALNAIDEMKFYRDNFLIPV